MADYDNRNTQYTTAEFAMGPTPGGDAEENLPECKGNHDGPMQGVR